MDVKSLQHRFVLITKKCEYSTELFFLQDQLQKYYVQHYDITSTIPKPLNDDEINGKSGGWIEEDTFTAIDGAITDDINDISLLSWKISREEYLLTKNSEMKIRLNGRIKNRGILFRETMKQFLFPIIKALRVENMQKFHLKWLRICGIIFWIQNLNK